MTQKNMISERGRALILAATVLDRPGGDPDDDLAILARQLTQAQEEIDQADQPRFGDGREERHLSAAEEMLRQNEAAHDPAADRMLQFFEYGHLPIELRGTSQLFHWLAHKIIADVPRNAERSAGLRKLLEAKDCIVRARLYK